MEEQAQAMFERLTAQVKKQYGVTEELKAADMMVWIGRMNNIRNRAEKIVLFELVYAEE